MRSAADTEYQIRTELVENVQPKRFNEGGRYHYYIRIFIEASQSALDAVEFVKYKLHPTFRECFRVSFDRARSFELKLWTYGYFDIQASLVMREGHTIEISGYVEWRVPEGMPFDDDP